MNHCAPHLSATHLGSRPSSLGAPGVPWSAKWIIPTFPVLGGLWSQTFLNKVSQPNNDRPAPPIPLLGHKALCVSVWTFYKMRHFPNTRDQTCSYGETPNEHLTSQHREGDADLYHYIKRLPAFHTEKVRHETDLICPPYPLSQLTSYLGQGWPLLSRQANKQIASSSPCPPSANACSATWGKHSSLPPTPHCELPEMPQQKSPWTSRAGKTALSRGSTD